MRASVGHRGRPGVMPHEQDGESNVRKFANLGFETDSKAGSRMSKQASAVGTSVAAYIDERQEEDEDVREAHARLRPFEELARVVIMRRAKLGLSQRDLAKQMGTTASVISRIESGRHKTSIETIRRLALALDGQAVLGFDFGTPSRPERELVTL